MRMRMRTCVPVPVCSRRGKGVKGSSGLTLFLYFFLFLRKYPTELHTSPSLPFAWAYLVLIPWAQVSVVSKYTSGFQKSEVATVRSLS